MKYLYTILAVLVLASCTAKTPVENTDTVIAPTTEETTATEETINAIDAEIDELVEEKDDTMVEKNEMVQLDATYTNPETDVDMLINYSLDEENKIEVIKISATTYDVSAYNDAAQVVIGMTLEEAAEAEIAGGSLTNAAFKAAIK